MRLIDIVTRRRRGLVIRLVGDPGARLTKPPLKQNGLNSLYFLYPRLISY